MITKRIAVAALFCLPAWASAQTPASSSSPADSAAAPAKPAAAPALDFSGILFANYQYHGDAGPAKSTNRFDVERAYLTFRIAAGKRTSVRVTTDLYQQTAPGSDAYYRGWTVRAKYAYLQYNYIDTPDWRAVARVGLLHTVFIDHDEQFWPRWITTSPTERAGYFASADAGLATSVSLPRKAGEVYATITNGPGYTSRETDRFKDYAARLTLTPWASDAASPLKTLALSAWGYKGATASRFVGGGAGQLGSVGDGLARNRWGVHAGSATPKLTFGVEYASRREEAENGSNTVASPRSVVDSTGTLASAYALIRPMMLRDASKVHPLSLMARFDRVVTNTDSDARYNVVIAGLIWDLSSKASFSLDYQETTPASGSPIATNKMYFAHFVARF
ncbi:MAG: hypothetical protein Q7S20_09725 [Gemmatimonadaceae bacterium]|nr:hypothetical protein [Gemmatimonadaceae bacterium]